MVKNKSSRGHIWMAVDPLMKTSTQFGYSYLKLQGEIRARNINLSMWHLMPSKLLNWIRSHRRTQIRPKALKILNILGLNSGSTQIAKDVANSEKGTFLVLGEHFQKHWVIY